MTRAGRRIAVAAAVVAGVTLVLAPSAMAGRTGLFAGVDLHASNGYDVFITAERWTNRERRGKVWVTTQSSSSDGLTSWSRYRAPARITRHHLRADLGDFGEINLRYRPGTGQHALGAEAHKAPEPGELAQKLFQRLLGCVVSLDGTEGRFKGRVRFRGEGGYVRVRAHRARGFISPAEASCSRDKTKHGVALDAGSGPVRFEADRFRGDPRHVLFVAEQKEQAGRVDIVRQALDGGHKNAFSFDFNPDRAHVAPEGTTMTGSADLTPSGQWVGSLAVSFPGAPDVPLTGPGFSARLGRF